ncbi:ribosylnicotinamide kinase [Coemansia sp. BCRC 34301]|nr:ribosylnicotinamide kinase [Coemansia sp. BCRC 34301]
MSSVIVVGVSGPSCSGKTAIALNLLKVFPHTVVIHQDDYYKLDSLIPIHADFGLQDWDCPDSFDMHRLVQKIYDVHQQLERPEGYDGDQLDRVRSSTASQWANPPDDVDQLIPCSALESIKKLVLRDLHIADTSQTPFSIILVEGILLFHDGDQNPRFHPGLACDTGVFIHAQYDTLKTRRESRAAYTTVEGVWVDPPGYFDKIVWPNFVEHHARFAAAHPELANSKAVDCASVTPDPWNGKVTVCSSDTAAEDTLRQCVKAILAEWRNRSQKARHG